MTDRPDSQTVIRPARLSPTRPHRFEIVPDAGARDRLADELGLERLRKLRFAGALYPEGREDWRLEAELGATVVQPCVVTLAPVTTRIEETVTRRYLAHMPGLPGAEAGEEIEMPEDDTADPLPDQLDLAQVMAEALALALPPYPRAADAALPADAQDDATGDADAPEAETRRPFAGLSDLLKKPPEE